MAALMKKIDFIGFISVTRANPNGDPINGNRPRTDYSGYGEMSAECIKRKIRNRLQDEGEKILVQSNDRIDDDYKCIRDRISGNEKLANYLKRNIVHRSLSRQCVQSGQMCEHLDKYLP